MHNLGLPVFMVSLFLMLEGNLAAALVVEIAATVIVIATVLFAVNLWRTLPLDA